MAKVLKLSLKEVDTETNEEKDILSEDERTYKCVSVLADSAEDGKTMELIAGTSIMTLASQIHGSTKFRKAAIMAVTVELVDKVGTEEMEEELCRRFMS